jgi:hypothetical protein
MCGRDVSPNDACIEREFALVRHEWQFPPSYNVAPTDDVPGGSLSSDTLKGFLVTECEKHPDETSVSRR